MMKRKILYFMLIALQLACNEPQSSVMQNANAPLTCANVREIPLHFASSAHREVMKNAVIRTPSLNPMDELDRLGSAVIRVEGSDFSEAMKAYHKTFRDYGVIASSNANLVNHPQVKEYIERAIETAFPKYKAAKESGQDIEIQRLSAKARSENFGPRSMSDSTVPIIHVDDVRIESRFQQNSGEGYEYFNIWFAVESSTDQAGLVVFPRIGPETLAKHQNNELVPGSQIKLEEDIRGRRIHAIQFTSPEAFDNQPPLFVPARVGEALIFRTNEVPHGAVQHLNPSPEQIGKIARISVEIRIQVPKNLMD